MHPAAGDTAVIAPGDDLLPAHLEPPGGLLVWLVVLVELLTFGAGLAVFAAGEAAEPEVFRDARRQLHQPLAFANTLLLLTGGWCMARGVATLRRGAVPAARRWVVAAIAAGAAFLVLKGVEYGQKIGHGFGFGDDTFFTLYFALTGFHFLHVVAAVLLLAFVARGLGRGAYGAADHLDVESCGIFWHMCDLVWLLLYPVLYLA